MKILLGKLALFTLASSLSLAAAGQQNMDIVGPSPYNYTTDSWMQTFAAKGYSCFLAIWLQPQQALVASTSQFVHSVSARLMPSPVMSTSGTVLKNFCCKQRNVTDP